MNNNIDLYFYNGMARPELIDAKEVSFTDRLSGNITDNFSMAYKEMLEGYTIDEIVDNQPLREFDVFVNPTPKHFQEYNKSILLDKDQYIDDFI